MTSQPMTAVERVARALCKDAAIKGYDPRKCPLWPMHLDDAKDALAALTPSSEEVEKVIKKVLHGGATEPSYVGTWKDVREAMDLLRRLDAERGVLGEQNKGYLYMLEVDQRVVAELEAKLNTLTAELATLRAQAGEKERAAAILADMFSASVLRALDSSPPRTFLYVWEQQALEWLKAWRDGGGDGPICSWTSHYMQFGPPPWSARSASGQKE